MATCSLAAFCCLVLACHGRRTQTRIRDTYDRRLGDGRQNVFIAAAKALLPDIIPAWQVGLTTFGHGAAIRQTSRGDGSQMQIEEKKKPISDLMRSFKLDQEVSGVVTKVLATGGVFLDVGADQEFFLPRSENDMDDTAFAELSAGDTIKCWVKSLKFLNAFSGGKAGKRGNPTVTTYAPGTRIALKDLEPWQQEYSGVVTRKLDSGVFVHIGAEIQGFLHVSEIERRDDALAELSLGETIQCWVKMVDKEKLNLLLTAIQPSTRKLISRLDIDQEYEGRVVKVIESGAFVDIGAYGQCFLHVSELKGREAALEELSSGDPVTCWIKSIDFEKPLALLTTLGPRTVEAQNLEEGEEFNGIVKSKAQFGAFIDIGSQRELLLHVEDLKGGKVALQELSAGDTIECWVKSTSSNNPVTAHKTRNLESWSLTTYKPGTRVPMAELKVGQEYSGVIKKKQSFGVFLDIGAEDLPLLHKSEFDGGEPELQKLKNGDVIKCWIKSMELKKDAFHGDTSQAYLTTYEPGTRVPLAKLKEGQEVKGVVKQLMPYGAFVDIGAEKRAVLHVSQVAGGDAALKKLSCGMKIACRITNVNLEKEQVSLTNFKPETRVPLADLKVGQRFSGVVLRVEQRNKFDRLLSQKTHPRPALLPRTYTVELSRALVDIGVPAELNAPQAAGGGVYSLKQLRAGERISCWIHAIENGKVLLTTRNPANAVPLADLRVGQKHTGFVKKVNTHSLGVDIGVQGSSAWLRETETEGGLLALKKRHLGHKIDFWIRRIDLKNNQVFLSTYNPETNSAHWDTELEVDSRWGRWNREDNIRVSAP